MDVDRGYIVTGAAGGMGSAAVDLMLRRGAKVLAVDYDAELLATTASKWAGLGGEVETAVADVSSAGDVAGCVQRAADRWGGLAGIFSIAGILGEFAEVADATEENYDRVMAVNAKSVWLGMKYALPALLAGGGGTIVNTGSHLAWHGGEKLGAYTASKHAIVGLTKTVAIEYGRRNLRANVVCPASMITQMGLDTEAGYNPADPAAARQAFMESSPNGRIGNADEPAGVGVWLLLDAPGHLNGVVVPVDGGRGAV
ncbi:MAG TPA: SDR family oxidoreductase [Streptosporangiaceae bacterium]|nr:SDR family oxidoreductase [Streptosporangiaceae bacterium]